MGRKPKLQRRRGRRRSLPSFFKVLMDDFLQQLRIPPAYKEHFEGGPLEKYVVLSRGGNSWPVELRKDGDDLFFKEGWNTFVQDNALEMLDFLVFHYAGWSSIRFLVDVFGKNCCLKEVKKSITEENSIALSCNGKEKEEKARKEISLRGRQDLMSRDKLPVALKRANSLAPSSSKENQPKSRGKSGRKGGMAIEKPSLQGLTQFDQKIMAHQCLNGSFDHIMRGESSNFNSDLPCFKVSIRETDLLRKFLNIPSGFSNSYIKGRGGNVTIQTSDGLFKLTLYEYQRRPGSLAYRLSAGWPKFAKKYKLKVGDTLLFELIDQEPLLLKFSICN